MANGAALSRAEAQIFVDRYTTYLADPNWDRSRKGEKQLADRFWNDFFTNVCGVADTLVAGVEFEYPVRLHTTDTIGWIDAFWPGVLLVEHKSAGRSLDVAEQEARDYLLSLDARDRPPVLIASDFKQFRIVEYIANQTFEFSLADLPDHLDRFESIFELGGVGAGRAEVAADAHAAELMSELFVSMEESDYEAHDISVFLVRCLFLLFGDDTQLWRQYGQHGLFGSIVAGSDVSGAGLGAQIQELFDTLDTPKADRPASLASPASEFPYANGGLFADSLPMIHFNRRMRAALLAACDYDWSQISPQIFGAMFQEIKSQEARRELGEHYTSEANILKVIKPLFLDEFEARLDKEWDSVAGLRKFHQELATYTWLDPACGCGNFLVVAYKRIRDLELRLVARLTELEGKNARALFGEQRLFVRLAQFHGIEYNEWSSQIAGVAMLLAEHQANLDMDRLLGLRHDLLPIRDAAVITFDNALRVYWESGFEINEQTFIMGNPPFAGQHLQSDEQKEDTEISWEDIRGKGVMDYVANWHLVAARYSAETGCKVAFVSTNSITQGEQVPVLWGELGRLGVSIDFAHQTFKWMNGSGGQAAVHTVIIGFSAGPKKGKRRLWTYEKPTSPPELTMVPNINAYLADAPDILITSRRSPLVAGVQPMVYGNKPTDGGFLSNISPEEALEIERTDPIAAKYLRPLVGADELIKGKERWCLWLVGVNPSDIRASRVLSERVSGVADARRRSTKAKTREDANRSWEFQEIRQPSTRFLVIPRHSSENRHYLPVAAFDPDVIVNDAVSIIADPSLLTMGIMSSRIFRVWADAVSGRLESRLRVSNEITYNNFPWPDVSDAQRKKIEKAAEGVLVVRSHFMDSSLADLYDPMTMPRQLREAHEVLDRAVASAFGLRVNATDAVVLARLFELYSQLTSGMFPTQPQRPRKRAAA